MSDQQSDPQRSGWGQQPDPYAADPLAEEASQTQKVQPDAGGGWGAAPAGSASSASWDAPAQQSGGWETPAAPQPSAPPSQNQWESPAQAPAPEWGGGQNWQPQSQPSASQPQTTQHQSGGWDTSATTVQPAASAGSAGGWAGAAQPPQQSWGGSASSQASGWENSQPIPYGQQPQTHGGYPQQQGGFGQPQQQYGQPGFAPQPAAAQPKKGFGALFDLDFGRFVTPEIAKVTWLLGVGAAVIAWLGPTIRQFLVLGAYEGSSGLLPAIGMLVFGWIPALFFIAVLRVGLDAVVKLGANADSTHAIEEKLADADFTAPAAKDEADADEAAADSEA